MYNPLALATEVDGCSIVHLSMSKLYRDGAREMINPKSKKYCQLTTFVNQYALNWVIKP